MLYTVPNRKPCSNKFDMLHFNYYFICRIDARGVIKVADFGMTEDIYARNYFRHDRSEGGNEEKVPIRWMAPESIEMDTYNERTDVVRHLLLLFTMCQ